jgi:tetratricopeptide (TPR) repeat protein
MMKAELLSTLNFKSKALECYDQILSKNILKGNELLLCLRKKSNLLYDTREYEKLLTVCNKILAIDENNEEALIGKCAALNALGKSPECLDCCNELLRINENSIQALNISSVVLRGLGRISESIENSKKMLTIDENVPTALFNLGFTLTDLKKYPEALGYINRFLEVKQTDPNAPIEDAKKLRDKLIEKIQSK